jgi:hypothetical protein
MWGNVHTKILTIACQTILASINHKLEKFAG